MEILKYKQLFRKDSIPEGFEPEPNTAIESFYDAYDAELDLSEVVNICENFVNRRGATTILLKSGVHIVAWLSFKQMSTIMADFRANRIIITAITGKQ